MAYFNININKEKKPIYDVKNTELNLENCNRIYNTYGLQVFNDSSNFIGDVIVLLSNYYGESAWDTLFINNIVYSDLNKFYLNNSSSKLLENIEYEIDVSNVSVNQNINDLFIKTELNSLDFDSQSINFDLALSNNEGKSNYENIEIIINPTYCSEESNPKVTNIDTSISDCDSYQFDFTIKNTAYSKLTFKYKTLESGKLGFTSTLTETEGLNGSTLDQYNLVDTSSFNTIITNVNEDGIVYYSLKLCSVEDNLLNKTSILFNIYDVNGIDPLYSYILTDIK